MTYKLYCIFSEEAVKASKGNRGKLAAQAGHAFLHSIWDAMKRYPIDAVKYKNSERAYKIACIAPEATLHVLYEKYKGIAGVTMVTDAALTVFDQPMITALGIGPIDIEGKFEPDLVKMFI